MDPLQRHRTLALLGIVETRKLPRDGDGDGFYSPYKGAPDKTPVPLGALVKKAPQLVASAQATEQTSITEHARQWHADLSGMEDLLESVASGATATDPLHYGSNVRAARVEFGNGTVGVVIRHLDADAASQADADQLGSAVARAIDIPAPRVLRVDDERTASDFIEGPTLTDSEDVPDPEALLRLGVLDLLLGIDERDHATVVDGPDGPVPVQNGDAFADVPLPDDTKADKHTEQLRRLAAILDDAGPKGLPRLDIGYRLGNMNAKKRDALIAELLNASDAYILVASSTGNIGHGARIARVPSAEPFTPRPGMTPPEEAFGAFWESFVQDGEWTYNPLTAADVEWLRERLDAVRPQFAHLGREHWWQFASDRLDRLAAFADGGSDLFADWRYDAAEA